MKFTKKLLSILCAAVVFAGLSAVTVFAETEQSETRTPIYADNLVDGTYDIEVTSSASMFKIVACELTVSDTDLTAVMTLSGKGYEKLYLGTGEQALEAADGEYIYYAENAEGKYTYTVPVEALDIDIDCAAFSFKKQQWYDRVIVFESDSLPEEAFVKAYEPALGAASVNPLSPVAVIGIIVAAAVAIAAVIFFVVKSARKAGQKVK